MVAGAWRAQIGAWRSMGSQMVEHDWATNTHTHTQYFTHGDAVCIIDTCMLRLQSLPYFKGYERGEYTQCVFKIITLHREPSTCYHTFDKCKWTLKDMKILKSIYIWKYKNIKISDPGIKPRSPTLQVDSLLSEPPGKPHRSIYYSTAVIENIWDYLIICRELPWWLRG